jgi:hypothetical protein
VIEFVDGFDLSITGQSVLCTIVMELLDGLVEGKSFEKSSVLKVSTKMYNISDRITISVLFDQNYESFKHFRLRALSIV